MGKIVLATGSKRRRELFGWLEIPHRVVESKFDEESVRRDDVSDLAMELARQKALSVKRDLQGSEPCIIIGADTLVEVDGEIIGKPKNREDARRIINTLLGREHRVITGVAVVDEQGEVKVDKVESFVSFRKVSRDEVEEYLETNVWKGKAGGYSICEDPGKFVEKLEGSFSNVEGLPLLKIVEMLKKAGCGAAVDVESVIEKNRIYIIKGGGLS